MGDPVCRLRGQDRRCILTGSLRWTAVRRPFACRAGLKGVKECGGAYRFAKSGQQPPVPGSTGFNRTHPHLRPLTARAGFYEARLR
jgi:hypothetical protein